MKLLKFCYFLPFLAIVGCGEANQPEKSSQNSDTTNDSEVLEVADSRAVILFFGNSLTAGLGVTPEESFPGQIANRLDSLGYSYRVINAGLSGETTASGMNRITWVLREKPDIFILELGANDGLRGIPLEETRNNLEAIVREVRKINPKVTLILTGMQIPPNMGPEYTATFKNIFPELAEAQELVLVPFLLEGVGGIPELNQADGIHPTPKGHKILAENVWQMLSPVLIKGDQEKTPGAIQ
jgi:acyl-CoA thioesterase-1